MNAVLTDAVRYSHPEYLEEEDDDGDVELKDQDDAEVESAGPSNGTALINGQKGTE